MRANLATLVNEFRRHAGETVVVAHRGNRRYATTYGELAEIAGRFAAELERRGVVPGDRVVLWGENSAEWIAVFFGCLLRGVIVVPLDAAGASQFADHVVRDVTPKLIVADPRLLNTLPPGASTTPNDIPRLPLPTINAHLPTEPLFAVSDAIHPHTPFQIVFTSGTTSEPRGIVHTHRNILVTLQPIENEIAKYRRYERWVHPLRFLHSLPLSHVFGQFMGLWCPVLLAAEVHFTEQLEPSRVADLIRRERISVLIAVPRVLQLLRAHLLDRFPMLVAQINASTGLSIVKRWWLFRRVHCVLGWKFWAVISGGATLPADLETFWNRLGFALIQGYGMTETAALVTLNHPFHIAPGTIGRPLPGREVRIADDGEVLVRGEMLSGATWSAGRMHPRDGEWLATGDLAEKNPSGDMRFLGRKGDRIVTAAGLNIHLPDLEAALQAALAAQPGFRACVVVPCQIAETTEPVGVVLFSGSDQQLDDAVANANRTLAEYQQIRRVLRWPEIEFPYTSTGKLLRRQVAQWASDTLHSRQPPDSASAPMQDALLAVIASITGEPIHATSDPNSLRLSEDMHLDSLGRVQLQSELEKRFGVDLQDDAIANVYTVTALRALLEVAGYRLQVADPRATAIRGTSSDKNVQLPVSGAKALSSAPVTHPETDNLQPARHQYPHWPWSWPIHAIRVVFLELVARPLIWFLAAPRIVYAPGFRLEPRTADCVPLLIISNHVTEYDGALILYALPLRLRRRVAAAMSGEMLLDMRRAHNQPSLLANLLAPAAYWLLTALYNVFPLPRAQGFRRSFMHAGEAMDRGYSVLIFPEGTRSRDGTLHPFRPGIGLLAQQSRVPILPIAIVGLYELRASGGRWFRSGKIEIHVGQPIPAPADSDLSSTDPARLAVTLEQAVRALLTTPPQESLEEVGARKNTN